MRNEKPYQWLSWLATCIVLSAAIFASFVPDMHLHHYFFVAGNTLWIIVGLLWRENSILWFNVGLTVIYLLGMITI